MDFGEFAGRWPLVRQLRDGDVLGRGKAVRSRRTEGLRPRTSEAERVVQSVCPYCAVGCAQLVYVKEGRVTQRHELPLLFAGSSTAAARGIAAALTPVAAARPARRLGLFGAITELVTQKVMEKRLGELVAEPYRKGEGGRYAKAAETATLAGGALMLLRGRNRAGAIAAGVLLATGSLCTRFAVYHAGKESAADPRYTSIPSATARRSEDNPPLPGNNGRRPETRKERVFASLFSDLYTAIKSRFLG
jgi:hypothetical protein